MRKFFKRITTLLLPLIVFCSTPAQAAFDDIGNHWAKGTIERLAGQGIVAGVEPNRFAPEETVTREQFVSLLMRVMKLPTGQESHTFADVPSDRWSAPAIEGAVQQGIINPFYYEGSFDPERPIPREEMAVMVWRALKMTDRMESLPIKFQDDQQINAENRQRIAMVSAAGIMFGYPDGTFKPDNTLTRAESCIVLSRTLDFLTHRSELVINGQFYHNPYASTYRYLRGNWIRGDVYDPVVKLASDAAEWEYWENALLIGAKVGDSWKANEKTYTFVSTERCAFPQLNGSNDLVDVIVLEEYDPQSQQKSQLRYARGIGPVYSETLESPDHMDDGRYWMLSELVE